MKKTPSVPLIAYNLAISNEGAPAALLEDEDEPLLPDGPLKTSVGLVDAELEVAEAVAVELVVLGGLGSVAPQGWSCLHALAQVASFPHAFTHWLPHSVQTK